MFAVAPRPGSFPKFQEPKLKTRQPIVILLCLAISSSVHAQTGNTNSKTPKSGNVQSENSQPVTIDNSATHILKSDKIGESYKIDVALPASYGSGDKEYPVVYVTDSFFSYLLVVGDSRNLSLGMEMPEVIVVGIGYNAGLGRIAVTRTRDLTPTNDEAYPKEFEKTYKHPFPADIKTGGADDFVDFIDNQLKPFINTNYRTNSDDETYIGYSFGGLFGLHVLFNHTDSFDKYIIGSPSIWWDSSVSFKFEAEYAQKHDDLAKKVFISSGRLEEKDGDDQADGHQYDQNVHATKPPSLSRT